MTVEDIVEKFKVLAEKNGYDLTDNAPKIARAKLNFFGETQWAKCPCVQDGKHACISPLCKKQIEEEGICHCSLFKKKVAES